MKTKLLHALMVVASLLLFTDCDKESEDNETLNLPACDGGIALADSDALNGANALDLCRETTAGSGEWGILSARYIRANGTSAAYSNQIGIMEQFGSNATPRKGERMLALSTGTARTASQAGACGSTSCHGYGTGSAPAGFPQDVTGCPVSFQVNDDIGLEMVVRVPASAKGFSIDYMFCTFDYPDLLCSSVNDQFVILVSAAPTGSVNGNVALDPDGDPITGNCNFMDAAKANLLAGTGYDVWGNSGTTGWLRTSVPVTGGSEITVRFIIYDMADQDFDSGVLLDNFTWLTASTTLGTTAL